MGGGLVLAPLRLLLEPRRAEATGEVGPGSSRVPPLVRAPVVVAGEALVADRALEALLARVRPQVEGEGAVIPEAARAERAGEKGGRLTCGGRGEQLREF